MDTAALFSTEKSPPHMYSTYASKPYTPRVPMSVQGPRSRSMQPLPRYMRSKPSTANTMSLGSTLNGTQQGNSSSKFAVIPYKSAGFSMSESTDIITLVGGESDSTSFDIKPIELARNRYAAFIRDMWTRSASQFSSPSLYADAILQEIQCREQSTPAMKVGAAVWALEIIAAQPGFEFLVALRNLLLPAVFVNYSERRLPRVSGTVSSVLHDLPTDIVLQNPFLSHEIYAEEYMNRRAEDERNLILQGKLQKLGMSRKSAVQNLMDQLGSVRQTIAFRAWRTLTRRKKLERVTRENRDKRREEALRTVRLQNTFSTWRSSVERSRSVFLSERLHNAAAQLENAKNQFQLQCFRSDKHLFTVEELRNEIAELRSELEKTVAEKRELEKRLRDHDMNTAKVLNEHANASLRELSSWRRFARRCVESLSVHDETVKGLEEQLRNMTEFFSSDDDDNLASTSTAHSSKKSANKSRLGTTTTATNANSHVVADATPAVAAAASETTTAGAVATSSSPRLQDVSNNSEVILLSWVRSILAAAPVQLSVGPVSNFTTDFQSGEVMLLVLHHVFPNDVPLTSLQDTSGSKRLERVVAAFGKCGVAMVPRALDFVECNSDVIFVVLAELFSKNLELQSLRKARELLDGGYTGLEDSITAQIEYTQEMLPSIIDGSRVEIQNLVAKESELRQQTGTLLKWQETVGRDAAFATRERLSGNPVRAIGKSVVAKYWKFKLSRYADLEAKYRVKDDAWKDHFVNTLRKTLQKHVHTTSRLFFRYAGSATTMNEVHFWRLAADCKFGDKPLQPAAVEKIFTQVAKPLGHNGDLALGPENVNLQEISPPEFIEIIIRVADARFTAKSLPERVEQFLQATTRLVAALVENPLHRLLYLDASQKLLDRYLVDLARVFYYYARRSPRFIQARLLSVTMPFDIFMEILDEAGAFRSNGTGAAEGSSDASSSGSGPFVTQADVCSMFKNLMPPPSDDDPSLLPGGLLPAAQQEMLFSQYLLVLGSLSVYKTPDPLIPADKKLEVFLSWFINRLRAKNKNSSLAVSDVKVITV